MRVNAQHLLLLLMLLLMLQMLCCSAAAPPRQLSRVKRIVGQQLEAKQSDKAALAPQAASLHIPASGVRFEWLLGLLPLPLHTTSEVNCGVSLIDHHHVITAAHCVTDNFGRVRPHQDWVIYLAGIRRKASYSHRLTLWMESTLHIRADDYENANREQDQEFTAMVSAVFVHPEYNHASLDNDIAILRTTRIRFSAVNRPLPLLPAALRRQSDSYCRLRSLPTLNSVCTFSGWGRTKVSRDIERYLRYTNLTVQDTTVCRYVYLTIPDKQDWGRCLCAGGQQDAAGMSEGDSGSGLVCWHNGTAYLAGVASSSAGDAISHLYPGNFMRISSYLDWIYAVKDAK